MLARRYEETLLTCPFDLSERDQVFRDRRRRVWTGLRELARRARDELECALESEARTAPVLDELTELGLVGEAGLDPRRVALARRACALRVLADRARVAARSPADAAHASTLQEAWEHVELLTVELVLVPRPGRARGASTQAQA